MLEITTTTAVRVKCTSCRLKFGRHVRERYSHASALASYRSAEWLYIGPRVPESTGNIHHSAWSEALQCIECPECRATRDDAHVSSTCHSAGPCMIVLWGGWRCTYSVHFNLTWKSRHYIYLLGRVFVALSCLFDVLINTFSVFVNETKAVLRHWSVPPW